MSAMHLNVKRPLRSIGSPLELGDPPLINNGIQAVDYPIIFLIKLLVFPITTALSLVIISALTNDAIKTTHSVISVFSFLLSFIVFGQTSFYRKRTSFPFGVAFSDIIGKWLLIAFIIEMSLYLYHKQDLIIDRAVVYWLILTPAILLAAKFLAWMTAYAHIKNLKKRNIVIVGANRLGGQLNVRISKDLFLQMTVAGFFDDRQVSRLTGIDHNRVIGKIKNLAEYVRNNNINAVYICLPSTEDPRIIGLVNDLADTTASIYFIPAVVASELTQARLDHIVGFPALAMRESPFFGLRALIKRLLDIAISSAALMVLWPLMVAIGIAIKLTSPGPIIFKQKRYGLDGCEISVYKFRTMYVCENGHSVVQACKDDSRITPLGRFLRKKSVDELPQLVNVIEGSMSIVGPRPHAVAHNELYRKQINGYMIRHMVKPGITGWAQINGLRGETSKLELMKARVEHDLMYIKRWSLALDAWIILRTFLVVLGDRNAY